MERNNVTPDGPSQQRVDEQTGGPQEGMSPQHTNVPDNNYEEDAAVYAGLGVNNEPDIYDRPDDEAADTILYTDSATARHATDGVSNDEDLEDLPEDLLDDDVSDDELDREISELAEDEEAGGEPY